MYLLSNTFSHTSGNNGQTTTTGSPGLCPAQCPAVPSSAQQLESSKTIGQAWNEAPWLYHSSLQKFAPQSLHETEVTLYLISVSGFFFLEFVSLVLWKQHLEATILQQGVTQFYCTSWENQPHLICFEPTIFFIWSPSTLSSLLHSPCAGHSCFYRVLFPFIATPSKSILVYLISA